MNDTNPIYASRDFSVCQICRTDSDSTAMISLALVRPAVVNEIRKDHPELSPEGFICKADPDRIALRNSRLEKKFTIDIFPGGHFTPETQARRINGLIAEFLHIVSSSGSSAATITSGKRRS